MKQVRYHKVAQSIYQLDAPFWLAVDIYLWKTIQVDYLVLKSGGLLQLDKGYVSDGPSGPTIDTKNSIRGAFVHDALYRLMRRGLLDLSYRKYADELLYSLLIEDGMSKARAGLWYNTLRLVGESSARYNPEDAIVCTAP